MKIILLGFAIILSSCTESFRTQLTEKVKSEVSISTLEATIISYDLQPKIIKKLDRVQLKVFANMSDGTTKDMDNKNWVFEYDGDRLASGSSDNGVLKIEQIDNKTVFITGLKEGEVQVNVTLAASSGSNNKTVNTSVKVINPISPPANASPASAPNTYSISMDSGLIDFKVSLPLSYANKAISFKHTFELEPTTQPYQEFSDGSAEGEPAYRGTDSSIIQADGSAKPNFDSSNIDLIAKRYLNLKNQEDNYVFKTLTTEVTVIETNDKITLIYTR